MAIEDRLASFEHQLRVTEERIRTDLRERDMAWRGHAAKALLLIARMIVAAVSPRRDQRTEAGAVVDSSELLLPDLEARPISAEEYHAGTPEKLELVGGYLFDTAEHPAARHRLLNLLLVNVGLVEAVSLAPGDRWLEALARVYGRGGAR
jgi:phosphoketolase